jgi:hypothetical protein
LPIAPEKSVGSEEIPVADRRSPTQEGSTMLRLAVITLLVLSFAVILDSRGADATAISADVYLSQFCAGCALLTDDTSKTNLDLLRSIRTTTHDFIACRYHEKIYCKYFGDNLSDETETEITKSINAQLTSEISDLKISVEYRDEYKEGGGCTDSETKFRDPRRVHEECENVDPAPDYFEFVNVFTLTTVSMISFTLLAGVWLLHRSFRNWQLRNIIARDQTTANLQLRKGRRRSSRPIRG